MINFMKRAVRLVTDSVKAFDRYPKIISFTFKRQE